jgi:hypothetical protein
MTAISTETPIIYRVAPESRHFSQDLFRVARQIGNFCALPREDKISNTRPRTTTCAPMVRLGPEGSFRRALGKPIVKQTVESARHDRLLSAQTSSLRSRLPRSRWYRAHPRLPPPRGNPGKTDARTPRHAGTRRTIGRAASAGYTRGRRGRDDAPDGS